MTREELLQELEALQSLLHHPGWEIVQKLLRNQVEHELNLMRRAEKQEDLLRHTYTYLTLGDAQDLPTRHAKALAQMLHTTKK